MAIPEKTSNRNECNIPINNVGDKAEFIVNGLKVEKTFVSENVVFDDDGMIIGVEKIWQ